jgi:hypothetical protein
MARCPPRRAHTFTPRWSLGDLAQKCDSAAMAERCKECGQRTIIIDNRGRFLRGCPTCNQWRDGQGNLVKLSVEDLAALHALRKK